MSTSSSPVGSSYPPIGYLVSAVGFLFVPLAVGIAVSVLVQHSARSRIKSIEQRLKRAEEELFSKQDDVKGS